MGKGGIVGQIFGQGGQAAAGKFGLGFLSKIPFLNELIIPAVSGLFAAGLAGLFGGSEQAQIGAGLGTFLLGPLGGIVGGLIGQFLFTPGRIAMETS